jgi:hypothetical protein
MSLGDVLTVIAVLAALLAVWYARATVFVARDARKDASAAHAEQMGRQADLLGTTRSVLEATRSAHEQEMMSRAAQQGRDLWLQRLSRLGRLQDLLGEAADVGRAEIEVPPPRIPGQPGTWTRVTGALLRVEAEVAILELLGCELPSDIRKTATECRRVGVEPGEVVSRTMSALQLVLHAAENDPAFRAPEGSPPAEPARARG